MAFIPSTHTHTRITYISAHFRRRFLLRFRQSALFDIEMKFWKTLRKLLDEIFPDWQDKFISYKDLKKQLNSISPPSKPPENDLVEDERSKKRPRIGDDRVDEEGKEVTDFVMLLEGEIKKFNGFFMDKEEEYIISFKESVCSYEIERNKIKFEYIGD